MVMYPNVVSTESDAFGYGDLMQYSLNQLIYVTVLHVISYVLVM